MKALAQSLMQSKRRNAVQRSTREWTTGRFRKSCRSRFAAYSPGAQEHRKRPRTCFEGPFGKLLRATGPMAKANPFRFSTKFQDDETDMLYYGYRYYNASTGGWLSRDPIQERGGRNLYGFVYNNPIGRIDRLGLFVETCPGSLEAIVARCACKAAAGGKAGSAGGPLAAITCVAGVVAAELVAIDVGLAIEIAALEKQNEEDARNFEEKSREYDDLRNRCRQKVPPELANPGNDIEKLCAKWRWELERNKDCIAKQIAYSKKWFGGPDERHWRKIKEIERGNETLEDKIKRLCKPCPEPGSSK